MTLGVCGGGSGSSWVWREMWSSFWRDASPDQVCSPCVAEQEKLCRGTCCGGMDEWAGSAWEPGDRASIARRVDGKCQNQHLQARLKEDKKNGTTTTFVF